MRILVATMALLIAVPVAAPENGGLIEINEVFRGDWKPGGVINDPTLHAVMRGEKL